MADLPKKSKDFWGPRLWRMFHLLAEISDRGDVSGLWRKWFTQTANIMPCEKCRKHLREFIRFKPFIRFQDPTKNKEKVRDHIRTEILNLHNHVNTNIGKPVFTEEDLANEYGGKTRQRHEILLETQIILGEIEQHWLSLEFFKTRNQEWLSWKGTCIMILALLN